MIPELDDHGLLPPGIHDGTLDEITARFGWTARRLTLIDGLCRFLDEWWAPRRLNAFILIDGSFVRSKPEPGDIDIVIDLDPDISEYEAVMLAVACSKQRNMMKNNYNIDAYARHPALPNDLLSFFQYAGDKASAELHIDRKHPKGILRLSWNTLCLTPLLKCVETVKM